MVSLLHNTPSKVCVNDSSSAKLSTPMSSKDKLHPEFDVILRVRSHAPILVIEKLGFSSVEVLLVLEIALLRIQL